MTPSKNTLKCKSALNNQHLTSTTKATLSPNQKENQDTMASKTDEQSFQNEL
jgi:hypothetical protein